MLLTTIVEYRAPVCQGVVLQVNRDIIEVTLVVIQLACGGEGDDRIRVERREERLAFVRTINYSPLTGQLRYILNAMSTRELPLQGIFA